MEAFYFTPGLVFQALPLRVLDSSATFVIAVAMLRGLSMWLGLKERRSGVMLVAPFLLLVVMVLGYFTVWVATLASLGAIWWLAGRSRRSNKAGVLVPGGDRRAGSGSPVRAGAAVACFARQNGEPNREP